MAAAIVGQLLHPKVITVHKSYLSSSCLGGCGNSPTVPANVAKDDNGHSYYHFVDDDDNNETADD